MHIWSLAAAGIVLSAYLSCRLFSINYSKGTDNLVRLSVASTHYRPVSGKSHTRFCYPRGILLIDFSYLSLTGLSTPLGRDRPEGRKGWILIGHDLLFGLPSVVFKPNSTSLALPPSCVKFLLGPRTHGWPRGRLLAKSSKQRLSNHGASSEKLWAGISGRITNEKDSITPFWHPLWLHTVLFLSPIFHRDGQP